MRLNDALFTDLSTTFIFSSTDAIDGEQLSEFWNRGEEASGSEEEISDSDGWYQIYFSCLCF